MTCHDIQVSTSLYLYGELDFAQEEEFERHLAECALCQRALDREKMWHSALKSGDSEVSLDMLSGCRQDLRALVADAAYHEPAPWWAGVLQRVSFTSGSLRLAVASFIFFVGFGVARWTGQHEVQSSAQPGELYKVSSLFDPTTTRIREIQPADRDRIRIMIEQVRDGEVIGNMDDRDVRQLLLAATVNSGDPGIRMDSVGMLVRQVSRPMPDSGDSGDIRDVLLSTIQHDPNAAVRLKALEGLRRFSNDVAAREALRFVLENDANAGVRFEAINILAPVDRSFQMTPDLLGTLQDVMRSSPEDDYIHMRCQEALRTRNVLLVY